MITFEEARAIVFSSSVSMDTEPVDLQDAIGRILAEPVAADADLPPFDRSAMDGYACRAADQDMVLEMIEEIPAGKFPEKRIGKGQCAKIMTGAPVPEGSDMVVRVEDTEVVTDQGIRILVKGKDANIRLQGEDIKRGEKIIMSGQRLGRHHIGIMAMTGNLRPVVYKRPSVGIISTGAELVPADRIPGRSEIRNSNGPQLSAQVSSLGLEPENLGIVTDNREDITEAILNALKNNRVVLVSGGVSAGDYDFVPGILKDIGMEIRFHKIRVRPGKPLIFAEKDGRYVFGIPGNPVSTFVQFECLIRPFLLKLMGSRETDNRYPVLMGEDYIHVESNLQFFVPVRIGDKGIFRLPYHGSGHLTAYADADGILEIPPGKPFIRKGEIVHVIPF